jgi:hypothetical protein
VPEVDWPSLVDALARVERFGANDSGLLSFTDSPQGGVFVERGRVCWVAAHGLQRRLRDLLRTHSSVDGLQLDRIYERCRASGAVLGQTLVSEGLLAPEELQRALRRHSAECLVNLCKLPRSTSWASHVGRGYAPGFTFRPVDLLFDSAGMFYPTLQAEAQKELSAFAAPEQPGTAFILDPDIGMLLPVAATDGASVHAMWALGRSIEAIPRANRELGTTPSFTLALSADGSAQVSWWRGPLLFSLSCKDRPSLAAATARRLVQA